METLSSAQGELKVRMGRALKTLHNSEAALKELILISDPVELQVFASSVFLKLLPTLCEEDYQSFQAMWGRAFGAEIINIQDDWSHPE